MVARKSTPVTLKPAKLIKPREDVRSQLNSRIEAGGALLLPVFREMRDFEKAQADYQRWNDFNEEYLRRAFSTDEYALKYTASGRIGIMLVSTRERSFQEKLSDWGDKVQGKIQYLESLVERLDLIDESLPIDSVTVSSAASHAIAPPPADKSKVFIVHGQDEEAKAVVARFVAQCGLSPIILHEQPNGGRTIIEKFEQESNVGFAIVLITPDDVGGPLGSAGDDLSPRARQNVILELGYFIGRLGRDRVAALKRGEVELPSDIYGVVWTALSGDDAWKIGLVRELRGAGYEVDALKALNL